ncbi:ABC transporter permease [Actinobaculum sp. 352]|uniref:ABC transporter permease n=1 Tax=Actinobaculum sp. 352 TaxID=2490946 RepID=UPI000F7F5FE0|nr:ABC transporter permease [Actinobaculum sp. 352]RTE48300.1 ABC transporter permease [Actinobaculum sp. 352]
MRLTFSTANRVLHQIRHDLRTLAIVAVVPLVLVWLLYELFDGEEPLVSRIELTMLAVLPLTLMFLLTAVATVHERSSGTLERLMASPIRRGDIVLGYAAAFGLLAVVQSTLMTGFCYWVLDMQLVGGLAFVLLLSLVTAMVGIALGLFASAVSRSEFQAVQLMPVFVIPQILLCGLFGSRDDMAGWLRALSNFMPASWSVEALDVVASSETLTGHYWTSLGVVAAFAAIALLLATMTLKRRTR